MLVTKRWAKKTSIPVGSIHITKFGRSFTILGYEGSSRYLCDFYDTTKVHYGKEINSGIIKHPCDKTVYGKGYIGIGKYCRSSDLTAFCKWECMFKRVYSDLPDYLSYREVVICESWHNFQNFAEWYYKVSKGDCSLELDKDLGSVGLVNPVYSPETCNLLHPKLNKAISKLPRRVTEERGLFRARCKHNNINMELGRYTDQMNALYMMRRVKLSYAQQVSREVNTPKHVIALLAKYTIQVLQGIEHDIS